MTRTAITATSAIFFLAISAHAAGLQILKGHVPTAVAESKVIGRVPPATTLSLAIGLPLRNQEELDNLLNQLADPTSREYRHYVTSSEFAERFGPTQADYDTLAAFFVREGFRVSATHANRVLLDVSGTVDQIERAHPIGFAQPF